MKAALLVIDVQNDFCEGGILTARNTDTLFYPLNQTILAAASAHLSVMFTRDWHPPDHGSFIGQGGPWPPHCVQNSHGAAFASKLAIPESSSILDKGVAHDDDGYSMFVGTCLLSWLCQNAIDTIAVCGIATEYCVLESVRDALRNRFKVLLLEDLVRPIEREAGDAVRAVSEMKELGATIVKSADWIKLAQKLKI